MLWIRYFSYQRYLNIENNKKEKNQKEKTAKY